MADNPNAGSSAGPVRLVIADVDGTLVTPQKVLTPAAQAAVQQLHDAGILFTMTSGRPPRGMRMFFDLVRADMPIAAFNGGMFFTKDMAVRAASLLPAAAGREAAQIMERDKLTVWVYVGDSWLVQRADGPHVAREAATVQFQPQVVADFSAAFEHAAKIVGVSDDYPAVAAAESAVQQSLGGTASASRSQPYYLDVTHPQANKGYVVDYLAQTLRLDRSQIATIGDGPNDVFMFKRSGLSIAMKNAEASVQKAATFVTASNEEEGFAAAIQRYILPRA